MQCVDYGTDEWICLAHDTRTPEWKAAVALGAQPPCRIPLSLPALREVVRRTNSPHTLRMLANDPDSGIRAMAASKSGLPPDVVAQLARDSQIPVVSALAANRVISRALLLQFVEVANAAIVWGAIRNPSATADILRRAWDNPAAAEARTAIIRRSGCPPDLLDKAAQTPTLADLLASRR